MWHSCMPELVLLIMIFIYSFFGKNPVKKYLPNAIQTYSNFTSTLRTSTKSFINFRKRAYVRTTYLRRMKMEGRYWYQCKEETLYWHQCIERELFIITYPSRTYGNSYVVGPTSLNVPGVMASRYIAYAGMHTMELNASNQPKASPHAGYLYLPSHNVRASYLAKWKKKTPCKIIKRNVY